MKGVVSLPWAPGGRVPKYQYIYNELRAPLGVWYVWQFATMAAAVRAQDAILSHGRRQGWVLNTSIDPNRAADCVRLGVRRVA